MMVMKSKKSKLCLIGLTLFLTGCSGAQNFFGGGESKPAAAEVQIPVNGRINVQRGDTVYALARNYGVPVRSIIDANNLEPPFTLSAGQTLTLPAVKYHMAERGDTIYGVARTYGVSVTEVTQINNMQAPYTLLAGQEVRLPASAGIAGGPQPRVRVPGSPVQTAAATPAVTRPVTTHPTVSTPPRTSAAPSTPTPNTPPTVATPTQTTRPATSVAPSAPTVITAPPPVSTARPAALPAPATTPKADPYADRNVAPTQQTVVEPDPVASAQSQNLPPPPLPTASISTSATATTTSSAPTGPQVAAVPAPNPTPPNDTPVREGGGTFLWPINGKVLSSFGPKENGLHNDGINLGAPRGTPIKVADTGTVAYVGNELRGFGNLVLIRHADGWITAYAHCEEILVKVGDQVKRGQVVARVGSTGGVDQPQLHFELRKGKQPVNPRTYLTLS